MILIPEQISYLRKQIKDHLRKYNIDPHSTLTLI